MMKRLAIVTSHPIQYNAPVFKLLTEKGKADIKVFYTWGQGVLENKYDPGFGKVIEWDIPLLEGYDYSFVKNVATYPGTHHFKGIINPSLNSDIEVWKADAILVFGWSCQSHLRCLRYFHKKIPVLFRGDSTLLNEKKNARTFLRRLFLKWVYTHVDYAFYPGTNSKAYFLAHGLKEKQLLYAPHAVDNNRFFDQTGEYNRKAKEKRQRLGFTDEDLVMLFAGKFDKNKNPFFLLDILKKINDKRLKALFVGNGKLEQSLRAAAKGDERAIFLDFQNQQLMPVIYRMADIFILPSARPGETWGLSLNEAMACGKAVVCTDKAGAAVDLISGKMNGIVIHKNQTQELIGLIEFALTDKDVLIKMGCQSEEVIKDFNFEKVVQTILDLVERI